MPAPPIPTCGATADNPYMIALYYCYVPVASVSSLIDFHDRFSVTIGGRIRASPEGINGVLSATRLSKTSYEDALRIYLANQAPASAPVLELDVKYCHLRDDVPASKQTFDKLSVASTGEVVSTGWYGGHDAAHNKPRRRRGRRNKNRGTRYPHADDDGEDDGPAEAPRAAIPPPAPAPHLSPGDWHRALLEASSSSSSAVLVDMRNVYESRIGCFAVPGVPTVAANTRSYRSFPSVLEGGSGKAGADQKLETIVAGKDVFMYCTGGVRCERASQKILEWAAGTEGAPRRIFQLDGGIQRYLEHYGNREGVPAGGEADAPSLFRGKNFVFDPRRTDPAVGEGAVGRCRVCDTTHDDYDNGHAPADNREARCCRCRILVLCCDRCRANRRCNGEERKGEAVDLFCGPKGEECVDEGNSGVVEVLSSLSLS